MQAIGLQLQRAPDGARSTTSAIAPSRRRSTAVPTGVHQHAAKFIAHTEASTSAELPRFIKDEFYAFLECGTRPRSAAPQATSIPVVRRRRGRKLLCLLSHRGVFEFAFGGVFSWEFVFQPLQRRVGRALALVRSFARRRHWVGYGDLLARVDRAASVMSQGCSARGRRLAGALLPAVRVARKAVDECALEPYSGHRQTTREGLHNASDGVLMR